MPLTQPFSGYVLESKKLLILLNMAKQNDDKKLGIQHVSNGLGE